jgi:hypothetical protein
VGIRLPLDRSDIQAALPGWVAGRVLTGVGWLGSLAVVALRDDGARTMQQGQGLFAWDGAFYRDIARSGYGLVGPEGARFHPLLPLLGRSSLGVLLVVHIAALLAAAIVHRLCREVLDDADLARRAATLVAIAPPSFCLVFAYAEGLFMLLSAAQLLALHRRRWGWAALAAALATLTRPMGVLLVIPALVVAVQDRAWRRPSAAVVVALAAPPLAMLGWLWWVRDRFGDAATPVQVQTGLRDGTHFPPFRLVEAVGELIIDPLGDGLHLPFALGLVALTWVAWRRLPIAWTAYATVTLLVILSAGNLNSIERYGLGAVPLVVAGASLAAGRWWRPVVVLSSLMLVGMATLAWTGDYVP